ncbi:hypothetical protein F5Y16DRAFT_424892 [Xylariaceae sp. FL0255]|nr:hypothetical protein F5Y16DRAFT_424892 [Xylariaceae sp. FL0255]
MQPAFAESLLEATNATGEAKKPKLRFANEKERRNHLLEGTKDTPLHSALWRYRPGQEHHELWKLMAQISFGVYLMLNGIANNNDQVVDILQGHIDEVDEFLETAQEDVNLGIEDIKERIGFLSLPMSNMQQFEMMLEDRDFRFEIVSGNEQIGHIVDRTTLFIDETFKDIDEGFDATKQFGRYLKENEHKPWRKERPELKDIFDAMKGNAQGWYQAFTDLKVAAESLDAFLIKLAQIVAEIERRAGEVSRRTRFTVAPFSGPAEQSLSQRNSAKSSSTSSRSRHSTLQSSKSASQTPRPESSAEKQVVYDEEKEVVSAPSQEFQAQAANRESSLYLLQPRTYTPQPLSPLPSPAARTSVAPPLMKRSSLRQRVSLKGGNLPEVIHVPPMNIFEMEPRRFPSPRNQPSLRGSTQRRGSEYGSGSAARSSHSSGMSNANELIAPKIPNAIPSPRSDRQQYFYPVHASPHSPLQQRPHTSAATARPVTRQAANIRSQRSTMGMSMLSNVTNAEPRQGDKTLKKKKSAFGWLKKTFTLDEEERAEFEARKHQQTANAYYSDRSPKFLDGKRLPIPQPYH